MRCMPNEKGTVVLSLKAQHDLRDIANYHKLRVGILSAKKITDKLLDKLDLLADFPDLGTTIPSEQLTNAGYRMLVVDEYLCFYSKRGNESTVHHIVHGSTDYIKILLR